MLSERHQYQIIRAAVLLFGFGGITALAWLTIQQWGVIGPILQPSTLGCGCQNITIQASGWMTGWVSLLTAVTLVMTGRFAWFLIRQIRRQSNIQRAAQAIGLLDQDLETGIRYLQVPGDIPQAMTVGFFHPSIILTEPLLATLTAAERQAVLRHEFAHQTSGDTAWSAILDSLGATWFWLPWFRTWITASFRLRELAADDVATNNFADSTSLGRALVKLASAEPMAIPAFSANRDRVEKLLDRNWKPQLRLWQWPTALSAVLVALGIGLISQIGAETAKAVEQTPAGVCQETRLICALPEQPTQSTVCIERNGWQCVFMPAMTTYGFAITPR